MAIKETFSPPQQRSCRVGKSGKSSRNHIASLPRVFVPLALNWDQLYDQLDSQKHRTSMPVLASRQECFVVFRQDLCLAGEDTLRHTTRYSTVRNTSQSHHVISHFREMRVNKNKNFFLPLLLKTVFDVN